jgi:peroxiredoxin Q/BCP
MAEKIGVGDRAPDFSARDQSGDEVRLSVLLSRGPVVLYFYPKDDTPGCTAEACAFRDDFQRFVEAGAAVVGVSSDSVERHQAFAARHELPFQLLSDADGYLRDLYGVPRTLGLLPGRVTYVIGSDGVVRLVFSSQIRAQAHVEEALQAVRALAGSGVTPPVSSP